MIDLTEIKKLPDEEKLKIIDEIEASMEVQTAEGSDFDDRLLEEMERRIEDMRSGKDPGYTWEQAMEIWKKTLKTAPVHE